MSKSVVRVVSPDPSLLSTGHSQSTTMTPDDDLDDLTSSKITAILQHNIYQTGTAGIKRAMLEGVSPTHLSECIILHFWRLRLDGLPLHRCRVGPSTRPNAGRGVFATRDIAAGELVTLYPGDALRTWRAQPNGQHVVLVFPGVHISHKETQCIHAARDAGRMDSTLFLVQGPVAISMYELKIDFGQTGGGFYSIVGDGQRVDDPAYLGHMINDFVRVNVTANDTQEECRAKERFYCLHSRPAANARFEMKPTHVEIVATKPIAAGQEIFITYGELYWLPRNADGKIIPKG